jgi:hypothetical protein
MEDKPMYPASTKPGGANMTMGPLDVCKTPTPAGPIPVPYANLVDGLAATNDPAAIATQKVIISASAAQGYKAGSATAAAIKSNGDEAGTRKGVVSTKTMGSSNYMMGTPKVMIEGKSTAFNLAPTADGRTNAPARTQIAPSQSKVLLTN